MQQNPSACDGDGGCDESPEVTPCPPYLCGSNACTTTCGDAGQCFPGAGGLSVGFFCDVPASACCGGLDTEGLRSEGILFVDSELGDDSTACCGFGSSPPCRTIRRAVELVELAGVNQVTVVASVGDAGGDWLPPGESYPITLSEGIELVAPGVNFFDPGGQHQAIIEVGQLGAVRDSLPQAGVRGTQANPVRIGMDGDGRQSADSSSILVDPGGFALYLANVVVNGSASHQTAAITLGAGSGLGFGTDQSGTPWGTVYVGNSADKHATNGFDGIICERASGTGTDIHGGSIYDGAGLGFPSLVIQGQEDLDIELEDYAIAELLSNPVIGVAPLASGFQKCLSKVDASNGPVEAAVFLHGNANLTLAGASVQCIAGDAFHLISSPNGSPTLTLSGSTIQNTERAIYASAGVASVSSTVIQFNYNGVVADSDGMHTGIVDLSGDGSPTPNAVLCSSKRESVAGKLPGVGVLNLSASQLDAANVIWDTKSPDIFSCQAGLTGCSCSSASCTLATGADGMDAVFEGAGDILTTGNGLSAINCAAP